MATLIKDKLFKPCPFCGCDWIHLKHVTDPTAYWDMDVRTVDYFAMICDGCGAMIKHEFAEDAVIRWNRRVTDDGKKNDSN